jgi:hypothetical protein
VLGKTGPNSVRAEYRHFQQRGVRNLAPGDRVTIAYHRNVEVYYAASVTAAAYESERYVDVTFDRPLPDSVAEGDVINVMTRQANILIRNNRIGKNRARGMLVSTLGTVLVEDNYFHTHGTAIRISGGVDHWYEAGPTREIMIRNNEFDHCMYGGSGNSIIDAIVVDADDSNTTAPYHETVTIKDNLFRTEHGNLVTAYRVGNLSFTNNRIIVEPYQRDDVTSDTPFELKAVGSFSLTGNIVKGKSWPDFQQQ